MLTYELYVASDYAPNLLQASRTTGFILYQCIYKRFIIRWNKYIIFQLVNKEKRKARKFYSTVDKGYTDIIAYIYAYYRRLNV